MSPSSVNEPRIVLVIIVNSKRVRTGIPIFPPGIQSEAFRRGNADFRGEFSRLSAIRVEERAESNFSFDARPHFREFPFTVR